MAVIAKVFPQRQTLCSHLKTGFPSELSVLSSTELTSLTAFFIEFEPENPTEDQVNMERIRLICNIDFCNGEEMMEKDKSIIGRFSRAAFNFQSAQTTTTTTTTVTPLNADASTSCESLSTSTSLAPGLWPWHIALIVIVYLNGNR